MADETPERREARERAAQKERAAAAARMAQQGTWVDLQLRRAMERGDFENLPGYGKPLPALTGDHDPDWWVKRLVEREQITGIVPPSLQVRREDAALDDLLDRLPNEAEVRREVEEFNARVRWALYRPPEGPPVVTPQRDPDVEVDRWADRLRRRRAGHAAAAAAASQAPEQPDRPAARRSRLRLSRLWLSRLWRRRR